MEVKDKEGEEKGDICNRDGCKGILEDDGSMDDRSCSCHINAPCSKCETDTIRCSECDWNYQEEWDNKYKVSQVNVDYYKNQQLEAQKRREEFYLLYRSSILVENFEYRVEGHTHFTMKKVGVFPVNMSIEDVRANVKGTFGGRFTSYNKEIGRFEYISYTD